MRKVGTGILMFFMRLLGKQPLSWHYAWAGFIKWVLKDVLHYRKDVIYVNLGRSFPDKKYKQLKPIADAYYRHMAEIIVEAIWFGACTNPERLRKQNICTATNASLLNELYEQCPSVMIMDSHCGNWELLGGIQCYPEVPLAFPPEDYFVVYKALKNKVWDEVFKRNRRAPIADYKGEVEASGLLRFMLSRKGRKSIYLINNDQFPYQSPLPVGTFLNQETTAQPASASLACRLGMAVLYMKMVNDRRGHYTITYVPICEDASQSTPAEIMRKYYDLLEEEILATPHNWLWSHKRWK